MTTYKIMRYKFEHSPEVVRTGLTLAQAQAHCEDPETSSKTATDPEPGQWFDGYSEE